jgi:hypothetical protein
MEGRQMKADEPAFPVTPEQARQSYSHLGSISGLSKREWFAGMALVGLRTHRGIRENHQLLAKLAFADADAMLKEADDESP